LLIVRWRFIFDIEFVIMVSVVFDFHEGFFILVLTFGFGKVNEIYYEPETGIIE